MPAIKTPNRFDRPFSVAMHRKPPATPAPPPANVTQSRSNRVGSESCIARASHPRRAPTPVRRFVCLREPRSLRHGVLRLVPSERGANSTRPNIDLPLLHFPSVALRLDRCAFPRREKSRGAIDQAAIRPRGRLESLYLWTYIHIQYMYNGTRVEAIDRHWLENPEVFPLMLDF